MFKAIAPGRVCLFGEHQDYLGLPVVAAAIDRCLTINVQPAGDLFLDMSLPDIEAQRRIALDDPLNPLQPRDYAGSVIRVLRRRGLMPVQGARVEVTSNIPINAGASSSSALTVAWAAALIELAGKSGRIDTAELGKIAYEAEVLEHGEPGGMMDHFTIAHGGVIAIDTENYTVEPLQDSFPGLVLAHSLQPKQTIRVLGDIRGRVMSALEQIREKRRDIALKDLTLEMIEQLAGPKLADRSILEAAVRNHMITRKALGLLSAKFPDYERLGRLIGEQHTLLRDILELSTPKIERIIESAMGEGALGAKLNGSGGGGTVVLLAPEKEDQVLVAVARAGGEAWKVKVDPGARIIR